MQLNLAKSTKNVLAWPTLITVLLLNSGCASIWPFGRDNEKPITVISRPVERTPLGIKAPDPLKIKPVEWIIVTPANAEQVFKNLESKGQDVVLFALTDDGYQHLAVTMGELRNFINTQRNVIVKYKEYYEAPPEKK